MAEKIAKLAEEKSREINYESPFTKKAKEYGYFNFKGGKKDDITVIVSQILMDEDNEDYDYNKFKNKMI